MTGFILNHIVKKISSVIDEDELNCPLSNNYFTKKKTESYDKEAVVPKLNDVKYKQMIKDGKYQVILFVIKC